MYILYLNSIIVQSSFPLLLWLLENILLKCCMLFHLSQTEVVLLASSILFLFLNKKRIKLASYEAAVACSNWVGEVILINVRHARVHLMHVFWKLLSSN